MHYSSFVKLITKFTKRDSCLKTVFLIKRDRKLLLNSKQCVCVIPISLAEQKAYAFQKYPRKKAPYFWHPGLTRNHLSHPTRPRLSTLLSFLIFSMQNAVYTVHCNRGSASQIHTSHGLCCTSWRRHLQRYIHFTDNAPTFQPLTHTLIVV